MSRLLSTFLSTCLFSLAPCYGCNNYVGYPIDYCLPDTYTVGSVMYTCSGSTFTELSYSSTDCSGSSSSETQPDDTFSGTSDCSSSSSCDFVAVYGWNTDTGCSGTSYWFSTYSVDTCYSNAYLGLSTSFMIPSDSASCDDGLNSLFTYVTYDDTTCTGSITDTTEYDFDLYGTSAALLSLDVDFIMYCSWTDSYATTNDECQWGNYTGSASSSSSGDYVEYTYGPQIEVVSVGFVLILLWIICVCRVGCLDSGNTYKALPANGTQQIQTVQAVGQPVQVVQVVQQQQLQQQPAGMVQQQMMPVQTQQPVKAPEGYAE